MLSYPIRFRADTNGTILATSPDFPELTTFGEDRDHALAWAISALEEAVAARIARREAIPEPSRGKYRVVLPAQTALKVALYQAMQRQGVHKAELARRLNWHGPQVDRLLAVRHGTRLDRMEAAFKALGMRLNIEAR